MMKFVSKNHGLHLILDDVVENGPAWESGVRKGERTRPKCPNVAEDWFFKVLILIHWYNLTHYDIKMMKLKSLPDFLQLTDRLTDWPWMLVLELLSQLKINYKLSPSSSSHLLPRWRDRDCQWLADCVDGQSPGNIPLSVMREEDWWWLLFIFFMEDFLLCHWSMWGLWKKLISHWWNHLMRKIIILHRSNIPASVPPQPNWPCQSGRFAKTHISPVSKTRQDGSGGKVLSCFSCLLDDVWTILAL